MNLSKILNVDWIKFIYYNYFSKKVKRLGKGLLIPYKGAIIDAQDNSLITLYDGNFHVAYNKPKGSKTESFIVLRRGSNLIIRDTTHLCYGATIELHNDATVDITSAYINVGAVILSGKSIVIGKEVLISRGVYIYDSDHHNIYDDSGEIKNPAQEVIIEDHVWIGLKCTLLRGSIVKTGAMISTDSVVAGKIKEGCMAQGNPARVYSLIKWGD